MCQACFPPSRVILVYVHPCASLTLVLATDSQSCKNIADNLEANDESIDQRSKGKDA